MHRWYAEARNNTFKDNIREYRPAFLVGWGPGDDLSRILRPFYQPELYWFTELGNQTGVDQPELNYSAAVHADKWIPVLPNTDAAAQLAIAYTWIDEGTYDKDYVATHVVALTSSLTM